MRAHAGQETLDDSRADKSKSASCNEQRALGGVVIERCDHHEVRSHRSTAPTLADIGITGQPGINLLEAVRLELSRARDKVVIAFNAAEVGEPLEMLLRLTVETLLPKAFAHLDRNPLTKHQASLAREALFMPLALIQGATVLAAGTILEALLQEAHALMDEMQNHLDIGPLVSALPMGSEDEEFNRGRDIAVEILKEAHAAGESQSSASDAFRCVRSGAAQDNFFLRGLAGKHDFALDGDALIGFSSVMSAYLGNVNTLDPDALRQPRAEFESGDIGADGTEAADCDTFDNLQQTDAAAAADVKLTQPQTSSSLSFSVKRHETLMRELRSSRAAVDMLSRIFDGQGDGIPSDSNGLIGATQYVTAQLTRCKHLVERLDASPDELYHRVLHAASLAAILEVVLSGEDWSWSDSEVIYYDHFMAIQSNVEAAMNLLEEGCVA